MCIIYIPYIPHMHTYIFTIYNIHILYIVKYINVHVHVYPFLI